MRTVFLCLWGGRLLSIKGQMVQLFRTSLDFNTSPRLRTANWLFCQQAGSESQQCPSSGLWNCLGNREVVPKEESSMVFVLFQRKKSSVVFVLTEGSGYWALGTLTGVESRRAGDQKAERWMNTLDVSLERAELERALDPHLIRSNPVSFQAVSLSIWLINQGSPQPGSAKARSVSGNEQGTLCFSKDFSTGVTHGGWKEPTCTRHYRLLEQFFVLSTAGGFCSQSGCQSWSILGLYLPLVWLWWTQTGSSVLPTLEVGRNMFPNQPGNGASSQTEKLSKSTYLSSLKTTTWRFSRGISEPCPVFRTCTWSLFVHVWKAQENLNVTNFTSMGKTEMRLDWTVPFHSTLVCRWRLLPPCDFMLALAGSNDTEQTQRRDVDGVALQHTLHYKMIRFCIKVILSSGEV